MDNIQKLELQLSQIKKERKKVEWEEYLNKTEDYLKSLVGKTFMRPYQNGRFVMFKVKGYTQKYYIDVNGFYGDWSPSRWFELTSTCSIHCSVSDSDGKYFRPEVKYRNLQFVKITGKSKNKIDISNLDMVDYENEKYTYLPEEIRCFGKMSYENGTPNFSKDRNNFSLFLKEVPDEMWVEAKKLADENLMKTKLFWDKYEPIVKNL